MLSLGVGYRRPTEVPAFCRSMSRAITLGGKYAVKPVHISAQRHHLANEAAVVSATGHGHDEDRLIFPPPVRQAS